MKWLKRMWKKSDHKERFQVISTNSDDGAAVRNRGEVLDLQPVTLQKEEPLWQGLPDGEETSASWEPLLAQAEEALEQQLLRYRGVGGLW